MSNNRNSNCTATNSKNWLEKSDSALECFLEDIDSDKVKDILAEKKYFEKQTTNAINMARSGKITAEEYKKLINDIEVKKYGLERIIEDAADIATQERQERLYSGRKIT